MPLKPLLRPLYAPALRQWRRKRQQMRAQGRIRDEVRRALCEGRPVKVIVGAGQTRYAGWIPTDMPAFDLRSNAHWRQLFPAASIDRLLAEHVFEHLTVDELSKFLNAASQRLAPGGRVRIAVPDGYHPDSEYIKSVRPGGIGLGAGDHKVLYTCDLISDVMRRQGYKHQLLEYFDREGQFHRMAWSADDGFVSRSADHDPRNAAGQLSYTSLIVDCWR